MTTARLAFAGLLTLSALLVPAAWSDASAAKAKKKKTTAAAKSQASHATGAFDGLWSVLIITEKGTCDRGYRYAVRIRGGRVGHADPANSSFRISGSVAGGGSARVTVARGNQSASGAGRLSRNGGAGRWASSKGECSGVWQAERRGG
jgi:hypothetical protein